MMELVSDAVQSQQAALGVQINTAVAAKAQDLMEVQGQMLLELMQSAADMGIGGKMNIVG
ncbi:MAG TPA: hypothetical protein PK364_00030 [Synergistaceae bacterium]|nr:hypothetical protein [Synergistaceae bacterium]HPJ25399.1 hypothetical protein [Synergistaceae bacterium]HPQ37578.1 hypothetical protein [Synergistaceae bacterium]